MRKLIIPLALSLAVLGLGGRVPTLVERTGVSSGVNLSLPPGYVVISPLSRLLDALTLLSTAQSIALIVTVVILVVGWKAVRKTSWKWLALSLTVTLAIAGMLEAAAAFLPRPMAALKVSDPDLVRVDFHSHTGASHDVRKSFSAEDNREWHRAGGFDIAYITDHVKFSAVESAMSRNPLRAGEGVSVVSGMEGRYHRIMSTIVLGITAADSQLLDRRGNILPGELKSPRAPVSIIAIPNRNLDSLTRQVLDSVTALPNLAGIELIDAAPRGLAQLDRDEERIRQIAAHLNLALVAGSNNHGYGRTVAGWNIVHVPGWRSMPPDSVASRIENKLRADRSVRIIHRTRPSLHGIEVAAVLPVVVYQMVGGLTVLESISWVFWIWLVAGLTAMRRSAHR